MRSFSNILPNFATNLHLLVDSINGKNVINGSKFSTHTFSFSLIFSTFVCSMKNDIKVTQRLNGQVKETINRF